MSDFNPGDNWRQVPAIDGVGRERIVYVDAADTARYAWVREEPVPPLPTVSYTVIRVKWDGQRRDEPDIARVLTLVGGSWSGWDPIRLHSRITGFEVLAVPMGSVPTGAIPVHKSVELQSKARRETAKAVLGRVRAWGDGNTVVIKAADLVAREFGVES